jgi:hypothetical protein
MSTAAMQTANTLVLPERFSPARWWHEVSTHDVTIIHYLGIVALEVTNIVIILPIPDGVFEKVVDST